MDNSKVSVPPKSIDEIKNSVRNAATAFDPLVVLNRASKELANGELFLTPDSNLFKAVTLFEFENGALMVDSLPERYRTFAIDLSRKLQQEFDCQTVSGKTIAELAAINYIRTLETQRGMNNYLTSGSVSEVGVKFLAILSKELDRANRHYSTAIQMLRTMKQLPMQVTIKTQTAVVGNQQVVQTNSHEHLNDPI